jgi:SAM-dependent methyltransferase
MACRHPETEFLGIDLSSQQILAAQGDAAALGLANLEFRHLSILDVEPSLGRWDFILVHGVFSWVPQEVRARILDICRDHLAPEGIAYVSYNCYPGWHFNGWIRDLMRFGSQQGPGGPDLAKAMEFLRGVGGSPNLPPQARDVLFKGMERLAKEPPSYLVHDYLEIFNSPFHFRDFHKSLEAHGLQYLADAEDNADLLLDWPPSFQELLPSGSGRVQREQCADFLRNRSFRRSVLCDAALQVDLEGRRERIPDMWLVSYLRQAVSPAPRPGEGTPFASITGEAGLLITQPLVKAALLRLQEAYPVPVPFRQLWEAVRPSGMAAVDPNFLDQIHQAWRLGFLELQVEPNPIPARRGDRPEIFATARFQATRQNSLTNLEHRGIRIDESLRQLIPFIDGTRTLAELARKSLELGLLTLDPRLAGEARNRSAQAEVDRFLGLCFKSALLVK